MTPLEILTASKTLIDTPEKWTTNSYARNEQGLIADIFSPKACKFCSQGALRRASNTPPTHPFTPEGLVAESFLVAAASDLTDGKLSPISYNDTHCHANVMKMWDLAIQKARQAQ